MIYISVGNQKGHAITWVIYRAISWDSWCHSSSLLSFSCSNNCTCSQYNAWVNIFRNFATHLGPDHICHFMLSQRAKLISCDPADVQGCAAEAGRRLWGRDPLLGSALDLVFRREVPPPLKSLCLLLSFLAHQMSGCCCKEQRACSQGLDLVSSLSRDIRGPYFQGETSWLCLIINLST